MAKSSFVYRGSQRTTEDVSRRSKLTSGRYDSPILEGFAKYKPKVGENTIRIMPPTWADVEKYGTGWELQIYQHYQVGPDEGAFLCLDKMSGEVCPICEARRTAVDDQERSDLAPSLGCLVWLIDRDDEKSGPQLWTMPLKKVFRVINALSIDRKGGGVILIDDPEEGFDISFMREGTTKTNTEYTGVQVSRDPTPLHDDQKIQDKWLNYITENSLPSVLNFQDADYIEKVLSGKVSRATAEDEAGADDPPPRTARRPSASRGESDQEAEGEAEARPSRRAARQTEEAEAEPRRTTRRPAAEPVEEDIPFDPDTGEIQDDPPPRTARRATREPDPEPEADPAPRRTTRRPAAEPAEEDVPSQSRTARAGLERLRPGARR